MQDVPDMAEREDIVARLQQLSADQRLQERALSRYAEVYAVAPEGQWPPEKVQIAFQLQTLYFQPGVSTRLPAYITTIVELWVPQEDYGKYFLFTNLDGSDRDDYEIWTTNRIGRLEKDYGPGSPIEPVELRNVPPEMQAIFPRLAALAHHQQLVDWAHKHCSVWFQQHPDWYQHYPLSLAEEEIEKGFRWFHEYPAWFQSYPNVSFAGPQVRMDFYKQVLCFNHGIYQYPHVKTYLNVYASGYHMGSYCLVTRLDGTLDTRLSGILPAPFNL